MHRSSASTVPVFVLGLAIALASPAAAQHARAGSHPGTPTPDANGLKVLNIEDYGRWNRVAGAGLSADGRWVTYTYIPNEGRPTLHIAEVDGARTYEFPGGTSGGRTFTSDSRWAAFIVTPADTGGRGGGAAARGSRVAAAARRTLMLLELETGTRVSIPGAAGFSFSEDSRWLAVHMARVSADTASRGADLILRELGTGRTRNIGNVSQYAFNAKGDLLAYTVDVGHGLGNGVYVIELATGRTQPLATGSERFEHLTWNDAGTGLLVYRGEQASDRLRRDNVLLAWTDVGTRKQRRVTYDPAGDASFPAGMVLSELAPPRWSRDGRRVFIGLKEQAPRPESRSGPQANVDIFHWNDAMLQSVQIVRLQQLQRATHAGVFLLDAGRVVQWGDSLLEVTDRSADGRWAVGKIDTAYVRDVTWLVPYADFYAIDGVTGERSLIDTNLLRTMGISDDGRWFLYLKNERVHAYNFEARRSTIIDAGIDFVNRQDDFTYEKGVWGVAGWSADGRSVLLYDEFDIWQLPLDGRGRPVNLTAGVGRDRQIAFCLVHPGRPGGRAPGGNGLATSRCRSAGGPDAGGARDRVGIDLSSPLTLSGYGEWTKETGYWTVRRGREPEPLIWTDRNISVIGRAAYADRILFTREGFDEFPDVWVSDLRFREPRRVTDANPFLGEYAWGSKVLIDYENSNGQRLQGTLTLPAGYQPGRRYPMIVIFYQKMSDQHHVFSMPTFNHRPQPSTYASNGYLVFQPDIVFEVGRPGTSALDCMTAAVNRVIELGYADPERIGMHGHSWSGYQSAFFVTQTDMFAAVVSGAPPTNLMSFYNSLYKRTGAVQHGITELAQVRMGRDVTPWNAHDLYESQSPIHHVPNMNTPMLLMHGTDDGAVDYLEGLQFYNAARRNGKQVILLSYPGEGHSLTRRENQIDFQIRMKQFFDHYLKGEPAPKWLTDGVSQLEKGGPIR